MFLAKNAFPCRPSAKRIGAKRNSDKTGLSATKNS
jgi:hypothetical protein